MAQIILLSLLSNRAENVGGRNAEDAPVGEADANMNQCHLGTSTYHTPACAKTVDVVDLITKLKHIGQGHHSNTFYTQQECEHKAYINLYLYHRICSQYCGSECINLKRFCTDDTIPVGMWLHDCSMMSPNVILSGLGVFAATEILSLGRGGSSGSSDGCS